MKSIYEVSGRDTRIRKFSFLVKNKENAVDYCKYVLSEITEIKLDYNVNNVKDELKDYDNVYDEYIYVLDDYDAVNYLNRILFNIQLISEDVALDDYIRVIDVVKDFAENDKEQLYIVNAYQHGDTFAFEIVELNMNDKNKKLALLNIKSDFYRLNIMKRRMDIDYIIDELREKIETLREYNHFFDASTSLSKISRFIQRKKEKIDEMRKIRQFTNVRTAIEYVKDVAKEKMNEKKHKHRGLSL